MTSRLPRAGADGNAAVAPANAADRLDALGGEITRVLAGLAPDLERPPSLRASRRMTRTLGSYSPERNQIALSSRLLTFGSDDDVRRVVLHEVAHALASHRHTERGRPRPHGREFRAACAELGIEPARFVDVTAGEWATRQRYVFRCGECGEAVVRKRLGRIARCACGARLEVRRAARVAINGAGEIERVEGYVTPHPPKRRYWR